MIDISMNLSSTIPVWPDSHGVNVQWIQTMDKGDPVNSSDLHMDLHCGTHVDCPYHVLENGCRSDAVSVSDLCGCVLVVEVFGCPIVTEDKLRTLDFPANIFGVLFKTDNSVNRIYEKSCFSPGYVGIAADAAQWLVARNVRLVGMDYLSIAPFSDPLPAHTIFLENGVYLLEGICLHDVKAGRYELICLPIKLAGAEALPVRAALVKE